MIILKNMVEGIRKDLASNDYIFDYNKNLNSDIIELVKPQIYNSEFKQNVYWFGYRFNSNASSTARTEFINYIKGIGKDRISQRNLDFLIELPLSQLNKLINTYKIDCFIYPKSGRSNLVQRMIEKIGEFTSHDTRRLSFELIKSIPSDVEFDWDSFEADYGDVDNNTYTQTVRYVNDYIMPLIRSSDYFSIAKLVKPKYRKYIKNYLNFIDEKQIEKFAALESGKNILIVDDINTSGATIEEILRIVNSINSDCNIYIYTLIGK